MADTIEIQTPDGTAEAFLAQGDHGQDKGGVLFFMDAIGLRDRIADMVDEIASWGYVVLAPNVFYRDVDVETLRPKTDLRDPEERARFFQTARVMDFVANLTPERAASDAAAYVATLQQYVGEARLAAVGYCMGARLAVRAAGQFPGLIVAVGGFHGGGLVTDEPDSPHTKLTAQAEYVFGHADNDRSMTPEHAARLEEALKAAGATYTAAIYPDAPHGYTMEDTSMWHRPSFERARDELKALLERRLG